MDLERAVLSAGGVARTAPLRARGVTSRAVAAAVASGDLLRPRRGWLAHPHADPLLIAAARDGVVLTCVTQARRSGLWVLGDGPHHLAAPTHAGHVSIRGAVLHWGVPVVARPPGMLEDPIENVLVQTALCQPWEIALAIWESALNKKVVEKPALARLDLPAVARRLLDVATPWSDSGVETLVIPRLRWMRLSLRQQIWIAGHRVDLLIGERLVLQADGGHHVGAQRESDNAHDAALALLGYHVIRVGYRQVVEDWADVQDQVMRAVAQGLHLARP